MSNDPHQPEPGQGKTPPKPSKSAGEATENDLWDLDRIVAPNAPEPAKSEALPPRRTGSSNILPKRPTEGGGAKTHASPEKKPTTHGSDTESDGEPEAKASEEKASEESGDQTIPAVDDGDPTPKTDAIVAAQLFSGSLTKIEKIAITALFAALILGATLAIIHFTNRIPTRSLISEETVFPVSGKLIEVKSAVTYWRKPITTGDDPDVVRRGTALIPVVRLKLQSQPGAIRVFFRDEEGLVIGDGISRDVSGEEELVIAATAGFDDPGMHAAYRTGEKEPWTVQVFEGSSLSGNREDFRKVLDTQISTDRR